MHFREKPGLGISLPDAWHCPEGRVYNKSVSQPFLPFSMWAFFSSAWCVRVAQLVSGFLSEEIALTSCIFGVSMGGGELRSPSVANLVNLLNVLKVFKKVGVMWGKTYKCVF